jgi:hypothetical protein
MLTTEDIEAIAIRVNELQRRPPSPLPEMITTAEVARRLNLSEDWVRSHAAELGGIRIGDSNRTALRFDPRDVAAALEQRKLDQPARKRRRRPGPKAAPSGIKLLPLPPRRGATERVGGRADGHS